MASRQPEINMRQQNIIRALLRAHGKSTLSELAEKTGLSPRVVRYNMDVVRSWIQTQGVEFINRPGYGIEVVASEQKKTDLLNQIDQLEDCDIVLSRQQRVRIILLYLLTSSEPVAAQKVSELEFFSRSTLFKDICEIESWLGNYKILLIRRSAMGLWIDGSEESRRFALTRLLREELGNESWYKLSRHYLVNAEYSNSAISSRFNRFINQLNFPFARRLITYIEENIGVTMSVISQTEVMVYLAIAVHALAKGNSVTGDVDEDIQNSEEYAIAQVMAYQIEKQNHLELNDKEKEIIAALVMSAKLDIPAIPDPSDAEKIPSSSPKSEKLARELINICSMRLHPMIKIDDLLLKELSNHLDYALFRLKHHIPIRNAHLETMLEKYPQIFRVVETSVFILENEIGLPVPAEEVGFIAMYLLSALERLRTVEDSRINAIILNDGVRSKSSLLKSRLEFEFPNIKITRIFNTFDTLPREGDDAEVIFSTLPIENSRLPVIQVSPFLEIEDIKSIQRWIADKSQSRRKKGLGALNQQNTLVDLVKLPHVIFRERMDHWHEIVNFASQPLIATGCIQPRYIDAMVDLIENHGFYMYMGSGVLLLHAKPTDGVNQLCISLLKLAEPFHFDDNRIPDIDLIFVLGATDDNSHLTALFQLNELIQFPTFMDALRHSKNPNEILQILWQWLPKLPENA